MKAGRIEVTGVPLESLVRAAYNPSRPQGLGVFAFQPGDLSDELVATIIERGSGDRMMAISMDYVQGRSCKFNVQRDCGRLFIRNQWYDHSDGQLRALLASVGLSPDLVDKAREEEARYIEAAIADATAFLKEHGGEYLEKHSEQLPDNILDGLIYGSNPGPAIKREWVDDGCRYSLAAAA